MKEVKLKGLDLSVYREKLDNGLEVFLLPLDNKKTYYITYVTKYGSEITTFTPSDSLDEITVPYGIAHFLEHKMFEQEDGVDPFKFFSASGTESNASTSYTYTEYICGGTKKFDENLRFLLDFVNSPYYTDENVEKEKGIIAEEINMYKDMPDCQIETKLKENLFHVHPRRIDIAGEVEDINKITKEDLYACYRNFYQPYNMFLIIAGNFNKESAISIVHEVLDNIENKGTPLVLKYDEPTEVRVKEDSFKGNINVPKVLFGLKIRESDLPEIDRNDLLLYLRIIGIINFGNSSLFREEVINEKIASTIDFAWEEPKGFHVFELLGVTEKTDQFITKLTDKLNHLEANEKDLERIKKVLIASNIRKFGTVEGATYSLFDQILYSDDIVPDFIEKVRKLDLKTLNKVIKSIDVNNLAYVKMMPDK